MKILLMTLFLAFGCNDKSEKVERSDSFSTDEEYRQVQEYLDLVNAHRTSNGLRPFIHSLVIENEAQIHSVRMGSGKIDFGHDDFKNRCLKIKSHHQSGNLCAENVARYQKNAQEVLRSWLSSPGHLKNINNEKLSHTGVGLSINAKGEFYWTQLFLEVL